MKIFRWFYIIILTSVTFISCKDDESIAPLPPSQTCLLMSKLNFSGSGNWYRYNNKNQLIMDSSDVYDFTYYYFDSLDKLAYSSRVLNNSTPIINLYQYENQTLRESILFYIQNGDTNLLESYSYDIDAKNRIISIIRYQYSGTNKLPISKKTLNYNSDNDIAEIITYQSNGSTFTPITKEVYEYSASNSEPTLNFIIFNDILLTGNKKLVSKTNYYNYIVSTNTFETTPSSERTVEIRLNEDRKPTLFLFSLNWGTLNYACN